MNRRILTCLGVGIVSAVVMAALLAPWISPHGPLALNLAHRLQGPSAEYPLGTDELGRCVLSRVLYGARYSLFIGITCVCLMSFVGLAIGLVSGYAGGLLDALMMRMVDGVLAFPGIVLALIVIGIVGTGMLQVTLALAIVGWTHYARIVRGLVLALKSEDYIESARSLGYHPAFILWRYILPGVIPHLMVMATLGLGTVILNASGMSFLGLGLEPPTPEWGMMIASGWPFLRSAPHVSLAPSAALTATVLGMFLIGEGIRDRLSIRRHPNN